MDPLDRVRSYTEGQPLMKKVIPADELGRCDADLANVLNRTDHPSTHVAALPHRYRNISLRE